MLADPGMLSGINFYCFIRPTTTTLSLSESFGMDQNVHSLEARISNESCVTHIFVH